MIPVLYAEDAIVLQHDASTDSYSYAFPQNHGLGSLSEAISCKVVEERNGQYELEMEYPVTGKRFSGLKVEALIKAPHDDTKEQEFFRIYKVTKPMNGRVTVYARHFSYYLSKVVVMPFMGDDAALGPAAALRKMCALSMPRHGFTVSSDLPMATRYEVKEPKTFRSIIGGSQDSLIDTFAGEVEWKGSSVRLWSARNMGIDSGVVLKYGKNLTDLKATEDSSGIWTGILPFWKGQYTSTTGRVTDLVTHADEPVYTDAVDGYVFRMVIPVDLTSEFEPDEKVTKEALVEKARAYIQANAIDAIPLTIDVSFVPLWQTEEYKSVAALERLKLCDTLTIRHERLGIDYTAKIIKVEYDVLRERYLTMTIGQAGSNFVESVRSAIDNATADVPTMSAMQQAIAHATELIQGGAGGHMVQGLDEDGKPHELYFMDTADVNTAMKVLRINMNGIGFSATGFNGPYHSAWTLDGRFVADYICVGSINASLIDTGVLNASLMTAGALKIVKKDEYGKPVLVDGKEKVLLLADADRGRLDIVADSFSLVSGETIDSISQATVDSYDATVQEYIRGIQDQLDGKVDWYFIHGMPTSYTYEDNYAISPNRDWTTDEEKAEHLGDCCYDLDSGKAYRWTYACYGTIVKFSEDSETYNTNDYVKIFTREEGNCRLIAGVGGSGMAGKSFFVPSNTVFVFWHTNSQYNARYGFRLTATRGYGDPDSGAAATETSYSDKSQITYSNKRVPDWLADEIEGTICESTHSPYLNDQDELYAWTPTTGAVTRAYRWLEIVDESVKKALADAAAAQDTADGKRRNFLTQPVPPYDKGDIWMDGEEIRACVWARKKGESFDKSDWASKNTYTDKTYLESELQKRDQHWSDEDTVFATLFKNGKRGFVYDESAKKMYISMDLMKGGKIKLGGTSNNYGDGELGIYDADGYQIFYFDKDGMEVKNSSGQTVFILKPGSSNGMVLCAKGTNGLNTFYLDKSKMEFNEIYYDSGYYRSRNLLKVSSDNGFESFSQRGNETEELKMLNAILYGYQGGSLISFIDFSADEGTANHPMVIRNNSNGIRHEAYETLFRDLYGNSAMSVSYNGGILAYVNTGGFSDVRAKKNIEPASGFMEKLRQLRVVSFDWKDGHYPGHVSAGLIAQEVREVLPELVQEDPRGMLGISFDGLVPFLVEALQEKDREIRSLREEVSGLEARILALEEKLCKISR